MASHREEIVKGVKGEVRYGEQLSRHTSLKVGGPADLFVLPADRADLAALIANLNAVRIPCLVLGGGYNLLVRDKGFRGAVISLEHLAAIHAPEGDLVVAEAGTGNGRLVRFTEERGLAGIEFLIGIPGTLGGALAMNAGAHGEVIVDRLETLTTFRDGITTVTAKGELQYGYRFLRLLPGEIIMGASFRLGKGNPVENAGRIDAFLAHRRQAQRVSWPNAGSFFKNPPGSEAWRLIDAAGLRGHRIGGAQVSEAHANFLVNRGGATARDFIELAELIKGKVRETSGILLEEEVRIVGEE